MDNNMQKDAKCEFGLCDGSGIISVPNGDSDFDQEFCVCAAAKEMQLPPFNPLDASVVLSWFNK
jgi:hypothetical protein